MDFTVISYNEMNIINGIQDNYEWSAVVLHYTK
jgi:hypothetical protein